MSAELLLLRIVHVLGAVIWAGTSIFIAFFLSPALGTVGPAAGPIMGALYKRKLFTIIPAVAVAMMLAGLRLMMIVSAGFSPSYFATRSGQIYLIGAAGALIAFALFMLISHPAIMRTMQLGQQMAQAPEAERGALIAQMNALRTKGGNASRASAIVLIVTAIAMAVGRYV